MRALVLFVLLSLLAPAANAYVFVDDEDVRVQVTTWARAGWRLQLDDATGVQQGPFLDLARLLIDARYKPLGRAFFNVEGKSGTLVLLDAFGEVHFGKNLSLRVGRDRVPTSLSFLVPAPFIAFAERSLINQEGFLTTRALGAGARLHSDIGEGHIALDLHAWRRDDDAPGNMITARVLYTLGGLELHAAYQDHAHLEALTPVALNRLIDVAAFWTRDGWTARAEALVVLDSAVEELPWVAHAELLRAFEVNAFDRDITLEPGFRYDISNKGQLVQRATAGLNIYLVGDLLKFQLNYDVKVRDLAIEHAFIAQLQGGL